MNRSDSLQVDANLTELLGMLVAALLAGESLHAALRRVSASSNSFLANQFDMLLKRVDLGADISSELSALCERVPTDSIREFASKLALAISRGTPLSNSLNSLALSLRSKRSAALLRRAGVNETKMLVPVVLLICPVTVIFALYPSGQYLAVGFL